MPSAGHARDGYQLEPSPECLMDNVSYQPIIHRLQHGLLSIEPSNTPLAPTAVPVRSRTTLGIVSLPEQESATASERLTCFVWPAVGDIATMRQRRCPSVRCKDGVF